MALVNEKLFSHAWPEMHQKKDKKIYWKPFEYTDPSQ